jgi:protein SCO1
MTRLARIAIAPVGICAGVLILACAVWVMRSAQLLAAHDDAVDSSRFAFTPNAGGLLPMSAKLLDETGRLVELGNFFAKSPVIVVLEYLRCTSLCGVTLRNLLDSLHRIPLEAGRDYQVIAVSIDPRDTPIDAASAREKHADQLDRPGARSSMHFLVGGSATAVQEIADAIGFPYRYDRLLDTYVHPAGFIVAAPDGRISRYIEDVSPSPSDLIAAIGDAEADKSHGPLARFLLLCHGQSQLIGRFTVPVLAAFSIVNIAAGLTVLATFAAIRRQDG